MRISDWSSDVCSSDLYVLHISQRHICHWVLGVAAFGTTAHFRTDKPPLPRQPVCHRLEVAGIPGEAGKTEYRRTVRSSEERRVGKEGVRPLRFRWGAVH